MNRYPAARLLASLLLLTSLPAAAQLSATASWATEVET
ncbi:MAG: hypothetical protein RLZZ169_1842, partial [Pseudomonadota bacterium]